MTSTKSKGRPSDRFASALRALRRSLDEMGIPSAIIGGIAINANGIARFTEDVDATIPGAGLDLDRLVRTLGKNRIAARAPDVVEFARQNQVLLLHHVPSGIDLDLSLAWIAFELEAIKHALDLSFGSARIRAARPEDLLIYKLIANRPQDVSDAERLLLLFRSDIDLARVRRVLGELSEHLNGPDRAALLKRLVGRLPPPSLNRGATKPTRPKRKPGSR